MMVIRKFFNIVFLVFLASGSGYSQQAYLYSSCLHRWRLPYTSTFSRNDNYSDRILEELSKDLLRPPRFVDITISLKAEVSLQPVTASYFRARVSLSHPSLSGYLQYRSFSMTDVLMPSVFSFALKLSTKLDSSGGTIFEFNGRDPGRISGMDFTTPELAMDTAVDTLITGRVAFAYSDTCWQKFYARKGLVDDYYASAAILDSLENEEKSWNMMDPGQLPLNFIRISELSRMVGLIGERDFGNRLIKGSADPRRLPEKQLALYKISRTAMFNLSETLDKSGALNGYTNLDSISSYFVERLMRYIRLSSLMDKIHGRIYQDYLTTYYSKNVFEDDAALIQSMLNRMFPDAARDTLLSYASSSLMQAYRRKARALIAGSQYSDAVLLMENAHSMATSNPYLREQNGWEQMMSQAVNGIYSSYTGIASSSLNSGNVRFALEYLQKAETYREKYPAFITSDSVYSRVYRTIFIGQLDQCNSLVEKGDFAEAIECLNGCEQIYSGRALEILYPDISRKRDIARTGLAGNFAKLCARALKQDKPDSALIYFDKGLAVASELPPSMRQVPSLDSLAPAVAVIRVKKTNALATAYYSQRQFSRAILQFENASRISREYSLPPDPVSDSVCRQSYKQWLLDRISQEQRLIWSDKPDSAERFLALAAETARSRQLEQDAGIIKAMETFRKRIRYHSCELMQDSLILYNIRAGRCFALKTFGRGVWILENAIRQAGRIGYCNSDTGPLADSIRKYADPAEYQNRMDEVNRCMSGGEYERGLQLLAANEKFYTLKRIDRFGLPLTSVYDYVIAKANPFISMQALEYYMTANDAPEALRFLTLLHMQGMPADRSDMYQEKLAKALASRDKLAYANADPENIVRRYTASNPWMGRFREVYIQAWKNK